MEYILFIHNNWDQETTAEQWNTFFTAASESGIFSGGSQLSSGKQIGYKNVKAVSSDVAGYMRFQTNDVDKLHQLLELHPVRIQGGTLELCETPST